MSTDLQPAGWSAAVALGQGVFNVQLRTVPGFVSGAWGQLQLKVNWPPDPQIPAFPPDPCRPATPVIVPDGSAPVSVCGQIENPGGATIQSGGLYMVSLFGDGTPPQLIRSFGTYPPDPCRSYNLGGVVTLPNDLVQLVLASPGMFSVQFDGQFPVDPIRFGGRLDGSVWGPVGQISQAQPRDPIKQLCTISIRPDA